MMLWFSATVMLIVWKVTSGEIVNVAMNKPTNMSSTYGTFTAGAAVDGDKSTVIPYIIHTATNQHLAWWMVDLQTVVQNATVKIYFRTDYTARRNGVQLFTSSTPFCSYKGGQLCHTFTGPVQDVEHKTCPDRWRYLLVFTDTKDDNGDEPMLDFAEVEVWGCDKTFGATCDKSCSFRQCSAPSTSCDRYTGSCTPMGCKAGWMGTDCLQECTEETYGVDCNTSCVSRHCVVPSTSCDHHTGACPHGKCEDGWQGIDCSANCPVGTYGIGCTSTCANCAADDICDHETGNCPGDCKPGWRGRKCTQINSLPLQLALGFVIAVFLALCFCCLWYNRRLRLKYSNRYPALDNFRQRSGGSVITNHGYTYIDENGLQSQNTGLVALTCRPPRSPGNHEYESIRTEEAPNRGSCDRSSVSDVSDTQMGNMFEVMKEPNEEVPIIVHKQPNHYENVPDTTSVETGVCTIGYLTPTVTRK